MVSRDVIIPNMLLQKTGCFEKRFAVYWVEHGGDGATIQHANTHKHIEATRRRQLKDGHCEQTTRRGTPTTRVAAGNDMARSWRVSVQRLRCVGRRCAT